MKKFILGVIVGVTMLSASVANAEFVIGVQGGYAKVGFGSDTLESHGLDDENIVCPCDGGDDFGLGFYAQLLKKTQSGNAAGIHIGYSSYSLKADADLALIELVLNRPNRTVRESIEASYDADILDVLGVFRWKNNFFLMAGYSEFDTGDFEIKGVRASDTAIDGSGYKLVAGWDINKGSIVISPAISYADYGDDISNAVFRVGIGYKFN